MSDEQRDNSSKLVNLSETHSWLINSCSLRKRSMLPDCNNSSICCKLNLKINNLYNSSVSLYENDNSGLDLRCSIHRLPCDFKEPMQYTVALTNNKNELLVKDTGTFIARRIVSIQVELAYFIIRNFIDSSLCLKIRNKTMKQSQENFCLYLKINMSKEENVLKNNDGDATSNETNSDLKLDLAQLLKSESYSDIKIVTSENKILYAHKAILAARSHVFAKMFEHAMKERTESIIEIKDIDHNVMEALLAFIYTESYLENQETAHKLLMAADKYNIKSLKKVCADSIFKNLSTDKAIEALIFADINNADDLKNNVIKFIMDNRSEILKTEEFESLKVSHPDLANKIVYNLVEKYLL